MKTSSRKSYQLFLVYLTNHNKPLSQTALLAVNTWATYSTLRIEWMRLYSSLWLDLALISPQSTIFALPSNSKTNQPKRLKFSLKLILPISTPNRLSRTFSLFLKHLKFFLKIKTLVNLS
jgi:hypothetical protein